MGEGAGYELGVVLGTGYGLGAGFWIQDARAWILDAG